MARPSAVPSNRPKVGVRETVRVTVKCMLEVTVRLSIAK